MRIEFPINPKATRYRIIFWLSAFSAVAGLYAANSLLHMTHEPIFWTTLLQAAMSGAAMVLTKSKMINLDGGGVFGVRIRRDHS